MRHQALVGAAAKDMAFIVSWACAYALAPVRQTSGQAYRGDAVASLMPDVYCQMPYSPSVDFSRGVYYNFML